MDGINSESSENGLIVIKICSPPDLSESKIASNIFSIVGIIDQPLYRRQFVTAC